MSRPVVIDTDPGVDDFLAILMALRSPALELAGLTVVGGNTSLENGVANALRVLEIENRADIPVVPGAARALEGPFGYAANFHGDSGLTLEMPRPTTAAADAEAAEWLAARIAGSPRPLTLVPIGPLTNIARLLRAHPHAARKIERLVIMGGAVDCPGNITEAAEFNIWNDPEAADIVLRAGIPTTLIGLDVCNQVAFTRESIAGGSGIGRSLMDSWFAAHPDREEFHLCDPLAAAVAIDPSLVETDATAIAVDVTDGPERGRTRRAAGRPPIDVALRVDAERAIAFISGLAL